MLGVIPRIRRKIRLHEDSSKIDRYGVVLRIVPLHYSVAIFADGSQPTITLNPFKKELRRTEQVGNLSPNYQAVLADYGWGALARLFAFEGLGGPEQEFMRLLIYLDMMNGNGKRHLPQGTILRKIYSHRGRDNPNRDGLREVRLVGNVPDTNR